MNHDRDIRLASFGAVLSVLLGYIGSAIENFSWIKLALIAALAVGTVFTLALIGTLGTVLRRAPFKMNGDWILEASRKQGGSEMFNLTLRQTGSKVVGEGRSLSADAQLYLKGELNPDGTFIGLIKSLKNDTGFIEVGTIYVSHSSDLKQFRGFYTNPAGTGGMTSDYLLMKRAS